MKSAILVNSPLDLMKGWKVTNSIFGYLISQELVKKNIQLKYTGNESVGNVDMNSIYSVHEFDDKITSKIFG